MSLHWQETQENILCASAAAEDKEEDRRLRRSHSEQGVPSPASPNASTGQACHNALLQLW